MHRKFAFLDGHLLSFEGNFRSIKFLKDIQSRLDLSHLVRILANQGFKVLAKSMIFSLYFPMFRELIHWKNSSSTTDCFVNAALSSHPDII